MALTDERKDSLLAYCKLTELADDPEVEALIPAFYEAAVGYMEGAGIMAACLILNIRPCRRTRPLAARQLLNGSWMPLPSTDSLVTALVPNICRICSGWQPTRLCSTEI